MRRRVLAALSLLLILVASAPAAGTTTIVLPRPGFPGPATGAGSGTVHFEILSSTAIDPARSVAVPRPRGVRIEGPDGNTQHFVVGPGYTLDFQNYAWPPRIA